MSSTERQNKQRSLSRSSHLRAPVIAIPPLSFAMLYQTQKEELLGFLAISPSLWIFQFVITTFYLAFFTKLILAFSLINLALWLFNLAVTSSSYLQALHWYDFRSAMSIRSGEGRFLAFCHCFQEISWQVASWIQQDAGFL